VRSVETEFDHADRGRVDVPVADRHARVVAECVGRLAHRGDEPCAGAEVADQVAGMQSLSQLAPVGQVGLGDLFALQHIHRWDRFSDSAAALAVVSSPADRARCGLDVHCAFEAGCFWYWAVDVGSDACSGPQLVDARCRNSYGKEWAAHDRRGLAAGLGSVDPLAGDA
jgi:hypothetical protein